jgi:hypothetical protein
MASFPRARQGVAGGLAFLARTLGVVAGVQVSAALFGSLQGGLGWSGAFETTFTAASAICLLGALVAVLAGGPERHRGAGAR